MATTQDIMDAAALMVGGTPPDSVNRPGFYSGFSAGDATGLPGLKGCHSRAPETLQETPAAVILPGPFSVQMGYPRQRQDHLRCLIFVARADSPSAWAALVPFSDAVEQLFPLKMEMGLPHGTVLQGWCDGGRPMVMEYAGVEYVTWELTITVDRATLGAYIA